MSTTVKIVQLSAIWGRKYCDETAFGEEIMNLKCQRHAVDF